MQLEIQFP